MLESAAHSSAAHSQSLNSPLLLAAATGLQEVCDTLLDSGADKDVQNFNDHGVYQKAWNCFPTLASHLAELGCPKTWSDKSGRTRTGVGQCRLLRHAMTTSASSGYTSLSAANVTKVAIGRSSEWP